MVDFKKLVPKKSGKRPTDPLVLFKSLDRKASHISLREPQTEALRALHHRRAERDHVVKMPTGTGKSAVGLLYLLSQMLETGRPVVYLCPTVQLVDQVLVEATRIGIEAAGYPAGERWPDQRCLAGEALIVCTYDKLFNAKSTFDRSELRILPAALVLDDSHSGVEEVRDAFTLSCTAPESYEALLSVVEPIARAYSSIDWDDVRSGRPDVVMEIPYWSWRSIVDEVRKALDRFSETEEFLFTWPYLRDALRWCRCVLSAGSVEIAPLVPLVERVRAFTQTDHRLFMSATLTDDSVLVRELGCAVEAAMKAIVPTSEAGLGERMVLAPFLLSPSLDRPWTIRWCKSISVRYNVVVLCSSEKQARDWAALGATLALGSEVPSAVERLKTGELRFVVFAQRYDGIDLPDDSCRVLVIDGVPFGSGVVDRVDSANPGLPGGVRNRTLNRIEQGMGRAVRSNADYAVCILAGPELASFITRREIQDRMSPDVRTQLRLAKELADLAREDGASDASAAFQDLVKKCLTRDEGWKDFYDLRVRQEVAGMMSAAPLLDHVTLAGTERDAIRQAVEGDPKAGHDLLCKAIDTSSSLGDSAMAGYLQLLANLTVDSEPGSAAKTQKAAFTKSRLGVFRPPPGVALRPADPGRWEVAASVIKTYGNFTDGNGVIAHFHTLKTSLAFSVPAHRFEAALEEVLTLLGVESSRPEKELGEGPDNLALWPTLSLVIEAKNEANYNRIPKKDAEQLLHSMEWFRANYTTRQGTPVFVAPTYKPGPGVFVPEGCRSMTPDKLQCLVESVERFLTALASRTPSEWQAKDVDRLLLDHGLTSAQFVDCHTVRVR